VYLLCGLRAVSVLFVALRGMHETVEWRSCRQSVFRAVIRGRWCGCPGQQSPRGSNMNTLNENL
jgi:hypothetical protein